MSTSVHRGTHGHLSTEPSAPHRGSLSSVLRCRCASQLRGARPVPPRPVPQGRAFRGPPSPCPSQASLVVHHDFSVSPRMLSPWSEGQAGSARALQRQPERPQGTPNWFICQAIRGKEGAIIGHGLLCHRCQAQAPWEVQGRGRPWSLQSQGAGTCSPTRPPAWGAPGGG